MGAMRAFLLGVLLAAAAPADGELSEDVALLKVPPPVQANSLAPNVSAGPGGVYLSWVEVVPKGYALKISRFDGLQWSAAKSVVSGRRIVVNEADAPALAAFGDGSLVVQWMEPSSKARDAMTLLVARSPDGGKTWEAPVAVSQDAAPGERGFVSFLETGKGKFSTVWLDGTGALDANGAAVETKMQVSPFANGAFGAPVTADSRVCDCCQTASAMTDAGQLVVYRDRGETEGRDISYLLLEKGKESAGWPKPKQVSPDGWKTPACPVNGPAVAANGNAVATAWFTAADQQPKVKIAFSTDGGRTFGGAIRVDQGRPAGRVDVAWLAGGWALVSWIERGDGESVSLKASWAKPDGALGEPIRIAELGKGSADAYPRMARKGADVFFTWTEGGEKPRVEVVRMRGLNHKTPRFEPLAKKDEYGAKAKAHPAETWVNQPAKPFSAVTIEGGRVSLEDYKGKVVLLTFFGTWCPPCRAEVPSVVALHKRLDAKNFSVIAVNAGDDKGTVKAFAAKNGMQYPIVQDQGQTDLYGVTGYPTNVVIDRKGTVRYRESGYSPQSMAKMSKLIDTLLAE